MFVKETENFKVLIKFKFLFLIVAIIKEITQALLIYIKTMAGLSASVFWWFLATCAWSLEYIHYIPLNSTWARD